RLGAGRGASGGVHRAGRAGAGGAPPFPRAARCRGAGALVRARRARPRAHRLRGAREGRARTAPPARRRGADGSRDPGRARARHGWLVAGARVDPATLVARRRAGRRTCFTSWVREAGGAGFVASTPELLVRRARDAVTASALAGSAPRARDAAADARAAAVLL